MRGGYAATAALLTVLSALSGCSDEDPDPDKRQVADPTASDTGSVSTGEPGVAEPTRNILQWRTLPGDPDSTTVRSATVTATYTEGRATFTGTVDAEVPAGNDRRISEVLLGTRYAVVVAQDRKEESPQRFVRVDLSNGSTEEMPLRTASAGGSVALDGDTLRYAEQPPGRYCLAHHDLRTGEGALDFCAADRQGFTAVLTSPSGTALTTFDDRRPVACRTLSTLAEDGSATAIPGTPECSGWEAILTPDGAVWSALPREQQVEHGDIFARHDDEVVALGPALNGTLTWCGDSAYFARDSAAGRPAQLLRWTPQHSLEIVYEAPGNGESFLSEPHCGGGTELTLSAYGQGGDERVSVTVPG